MSDLMCSTPVSGSRYSYSAALAQAWQNLNHNWWGIYIDFSRNLKASYRQTALGFTWSIIRPVVPITAYVLLATLRVIASTDDMPRTVYISLGFTTWYLCVGLIKGPMKAIKSQKSILRSSQYPLIAIIAASLAQLVFETTVRIVLIVIIIFGFGLVPSLWSPIALLILAVGCLGALGIGIIAVVLNAAYPDISDVINITLRYGTFLSGVIFPIPDRGYWLRVLNPFYTLVDSVRSSIIHGTINVDPIPFTLTMLGSILIFIFSIRLLYRMEPHLRGHIG
jgi:lipopolysaccharide transport system permease protein